MDSFHRSFERWLELAQGGGYSDMFNSVLCGGVAGIVVRASNEVVGVRGCTVELLRSAHYSFSISTYFRLRLPSPLRSA